jgi:TonB family protein
LNRVRENLGQLLIPSHFKPSAANGAPIHVLKFDKSLRSARAQGVSLATHAAVFVAIILILAHPRRVHPFADSIDRTPLSSLTFPLNVIRSITNAHPSDGGGKGGDQNPIPPTRGNLPPFSSVASVKPTLPQRQHPRLPEPPAILDPNAPPILTPTEKIGLPWMSTETNSGGPGKGGSIGTADGDTTGNGGPGPAGYGGTNGPYAPGVIPPGCAYCPYPTYTDEARHGKVQGSVTLEVLVGEDGRAKAIRIVKGIGFGLDEHAVETVQGWRFTPARDGAHRAVAAWVTVEAIFRLF